MSIADCGSSIADQRIADPRLQIDGSPIDDRSTIRNRRSAIDT
jgi:hypothetical protein